MAELMTRFSTTRNSNMGKAARPTKEHSRPRGKPRADNAKVAEALVAVDEMAAARPLGAAVAGLLTSWLTDDSGYDEEAWPQLKEALEQERRRIGAREPKGDAAHFRE
jgi:hypothetical protein